MGGLLALPHVGPTWMQLPLKSEESICPFYSLETDGHNTDGGVSVHNEGVADFGLSSSGILLYLSSGVTDSTCPLLVTRPTKSHSHLQIITWAKA